MKKIKKLIHLNALLSLLFIFSIAIFFIGCSGDNGDDIPTIDPQNVNEAPIDSPNTTAQDKLLIENQIESSLSCVEDLESGQLSQLLLDVYDNVNNDNSGYHDDVLNAFKNLNIGQTIRDLDYPYDLFNFSNHTGTYTYNKVLGTWTSESTSNLIDILFPVFTNSTSNDLEIQLSGVNQELIDVVDEQIYIPTSLVLDVIYNSEQVFGVNIKNVDYEIQNQIPVPVNIDLAIYTKPFTHEIHINRINSKDFSVLYSMVSDSGCITEVKTEIELLSSDYENLEDKDIKNVSGYLLLNDLKFVYNVDAEYLIALNDPTTSQINNYVDVSVLENDAKIGELKLIEKANGDYSISMVFTDGTEIDGQDFAGIGLDAQDLIDRVEGIISRYTSLNE